MFVLPRGAVPRTWALVAALSLGSAGCAGAFRCGCSEGCGPGRDFAFRKYDVCCEQCGDPTWGGPGGVCGCSRCGRCGCGEQVGCGDGCGKGSSNFWHKCGTWLGCAGCSGCGERYWSEWVNDPPGCEPCNCYGAYVGPRAASPNAPPLQSVASEDMRSSDAGSPPPLELADAPETDATEVK